MLGSDALAKSWLRPLAPPEPAGGAKPLSTVARFESSPARLAPPRVEPIGGAP